MLVFTRKASEGFQIGDDVRVKVLSIDGGNVRLGIEAPKETVVDRDEVAQAKARDALLGALRSPRRTRRQATA